MSMMTEYNSRPQDVGEILVKVQEDLHQLKHKIVQGGNKDIDLTALENAILKTEEGLKHRTEEVVGALNNQFSTLPSLEVQLQQKEEPQQALVETWDLKKGGYDRNEVKLRRPGSRTLLETSPVIRGMDTQPILTSIQGNARQLTGPTPGQKMKHVWSMRVMQNPHNPNNRDVMNDSYGIQLPLIEDRRSHKVPGLQVIKGSTVGPLTVLPKANRVDPQLAPPPISEEDASQGILSLMQRGLIPPAAELTLQPSPVQHRTAPLHDPGEREKGKPPAINDGGHMFNLASVKLDIRSKGGDSSVSSLVTKQTPGKESPPVPKKPRSGKRQSAKETKTPIASKTFEMPLQPLPPPTTPASGDFKTNNYRFAIQYGKVRELDPEFLAFKQHYCLSWGSIVTMLKFFEKLLSSYAVPVAFINGDRLADLALECELERKPSMEDVLQVIVNREAVEGILMKPGRRFMGPNGKHAAATTIQSTWRRFSARRSYLEYRRLKWASGVIAITWVMNVKMSQVRKQLKRTRADEIENFRMRSKYFSSQWNRIKHSKRVIIHLPSLGYNQQIRESIKDFAIKQNTQMARLCDLKDPNVDVLYISPVPVNDETVQYYSKLIGLRNAIDTGSIEEQTDLSERYKIIIPEAIQSFPTHRMCLATHLKYSPRALRRIKNLIKGRDAYIVTGMPHKDDLSVANILEVPIMCSEPEIAHLYSSKSGAKRIFTSAGVPIPPSEYDVYTLQQLHESLAQLVTENLDVETWLFKIDDEFDGRGIAYCNVTQYLKCHAWAVKEANRYGDKWSKKWAQEPAFMKISSEIPDLLDNHAVPIDTKVYPNWEKFLDAFLSKGGIVEAHPPTDSVTSLAVDMLIEPNGKINLLSVGDQIHAETPFKNWGLSFPQSSVEPKDLNDACQRVGNACKSRGVVGYFTVDFVTFIDPKTEEQLLWATDLSLSYSDSLAMSQLMQYVTPGKLDPNTHIYDIPPPKREQKRRRPKARMTEEEPPPNTNRFAAMSTNLFNSNLAMVHYSVFFQMCRAHGIGFDVKEKQGTMFTLIDSFNRENMGMMTIGDNLQGTLATFARNLSVIHQEVSAPNMQGITNFKAVIEDIEGILGTTVQNADEVQSESGSEVVSDQSSVAAGGEQ